MKNSTGVIAFLFVVATSQIAHAKSIEEQCRTAHDKLACKCALENGGIIEPDGKRWTYPARSIDACASCMIRNGRKQ
jgi:hypothetical protein